MNTVYIGYDQHEHEAYMVAKHSIEKRSSEPVLVVPLTLEMVSKWVPPPIIKDGKRWDLESEAHQATDFSRSRFAIPFLHRKGKVMFMDCDMVCLGDITEIFDHLADDKYAVQVVKHQQESGDATKMQGELQYFYSRKNWSSVMLWNLDHPAHLRLSEYRLNAWPGRDLHAFKWLQDDEIGELPKEWNYLVGVNPEEDATNAKLMHYTLGGSWIPEWTPQPLDHVWNTERMGTFC